MYPQPGLPKTVQGRSVKPYVRRQKNDAADAEAICEAVTRANMRFVESKTPEQQSCLMLYRTTLALYAECTRLYPSFRLRCSPRSTDNEAHRRFCINRQRG